jgi:hypothetical protein
MTITVGEYLRSDENQPRTHGSPLMRKAAAKVSTAIVRMKWGIRPISSVSDGLGEYRID